MSKVVQPKKSSEEIAEDKMFDDIKKLPLEERTKDEEVLAGDIGAGMWHLLFKMVGLQAFEGPVIFIFHNFYTLLHIGEIGGVILLILAGLAVVGTVSLLTFGALSHNNDSIIQMLTKILHGLPLPFLNN